MSLVSPTDGRQSLSQPSVALSQSPIWDHQQRFFCEVGVEAWRRGIVPSFVTSNPVIAHSYARLLRAYLADLDRGPAVRSDCNPVHIIELGTGSGRFSHFLLRELFCAPGPTLPARYVMTDISRPNLEFWRAHERFRPFVESGALDFALFDPAHDKSL